MSREKTRRSLPPTMMRQIGGRLDQRDRIALMISPAAQTTVAATIHGPAADENARNSSSHDAPSGTDADEANIAMATKAASPPRGLSSGAHSTTNWGLVNSSTLYVIAFLLAVAAGALVLLGDDSTAYRVGAAVLGVLAVVVAWAGSRQR